MDLMGLDIPLGLNASQPWMVGFYSSCGPVQYTLKAWCSGTTTTSLPCPGYIVLIELLLFTRVIFLGNGSDSTFCSE